MKIGFTHYFLTHTFYFHFTTYVIIKIKFKTIYYKIIKMKMFILCSRGSILGLGRKAKYIVESYRGNRRPWEFLLSYGSDKL